MGNTKFRNRIVRITNKAAKYIWILLLPFVLGILRLIINALWDSITGKYIGNPLVERIEEFIKTLSNTIPSLTKWIFTNPLEASGVWFFLILSVVLIVSYFEKRDPKGVFLGKDILQEVSGTYRDTGFEIINQTNYELQNCTVFVSKIGDTNKQKRYNNTEYLCWGRESNFRPEPIEINIVHGESGEIFFNQLWLQVYNSNKESFEGKHDLELTFTATTANNQQFSMTIYCIVVGQMYQIGEMPKPEPEPEPRINLISFGT